MAASLSTRCQHCGGELAYLKGGRGERLFRTLIDPVGNEHRYHIACEADALRDGDNLKRRKEQNQ